MKTFLILISTILASWSAPAVTVKEATTPQPPCCREGLPPGKYTEKSLYNLDAVWTADVGREVKLEALRGRPQVLAMFFTSCEHSCPLIVEDMKRIEKALPVNIRGKVDFALVSFDPERDTPEALQAYRTKHHLSTEHWSLLRGDAESVKKLADLIGFNYFPGSNKQYAHSLFVMILNPQGEIVFQQAGLGNQPDDAVATLLKLIAPKATKAR